MKSSIKKSFPPASLQPSVYFAAGCGSSNDSKGDQAKKEIKVGVTAGPHAEIMDEVVKEAAKQGLPSKSSNSTIMYSPTKHWLKRIST